MFFACEVLQLFSVVLYVVRDVHKFDFRLFINETPNKWRPVERRSCSDTGLMFLTGSICLPSTVVASVNVHYPRCARHLHVTDCEQRFR
jgi:hypothetical protein